MIQSELLKLPGHINEEFLGKIKSY